jgi:hypothetical protein
MEERRAEGRLEGQRAALGRILGARSQTPVPDGLRASIETRTDLGERARWITSAAQAASLEEFRAAVGA